MAAVGGSAPGAAGQAQRPAGCYKCGKTGHWSRDCTADPSTWIKSTYDPNAAAQAKTASEARNAAAGLEDFTEKPAGEKTADATKKPAKKRPKLTIDDLKKDDGLPYVYNTFPGAFRKQHKGKGHEAGDLRRFLEMYQQWQKRIFPYVSFEDFSERLEKLGSTMMMRGELKELRKGVMKIQKDDDDDAGWTANGGLAATGTAQAPAGAAAPEPKAGPLGVGDDDDDIFMDPSLWQDEASVEDDLGDMLVDTSKGVAKAAPAPAGGAAGAGEGGGGLTEEQRRRMEANRAAALARRQAAAAAREGGGVDGAAAGSGGAPAAVPSAGAADASALAQENVAPAPADAPPADPGAPPAAEEAEEVVVAAPAAEDEAPAPTAPSPPAAEPSVPAPSAPSPAPSTSTGEEEVVDEAVVGAEGGAPAVRAPAAGGRDEDMFGDLDDIVGGFTQPTQQAGGGDDEEEDDDELAELAAAGF